MMTLDSKWTSNTSQRLLYISRVPLTRTFDSIGKMPWRCLVMLSSALLRNERERALLLPNSPRVSRGQGWAQKSWRSAVCQLFISKYRRHPRVLSAPWSTSASSINLTSFCMCLFVWKDVVGPKKKKFERRIQIYRTAFRTIILAFAIISWKTLLWPVVGPFRMPSENCIDKLTSSVGSNYKFPAR